MNHLINYEYEGSLVPFTDDAYVNLTRLCANFGKRPAKFLELPSTLDFIAALAADTGLQPEQVMSGNRISLILCEALVVTINGGRTRGSSVRKSDTENPQFDSRVPGTWAHPDLALECARWLSPAFAIWCNRVVRSILSGQPYQPASDKPLHKTIERGIEQAKETLRRKHDAYWHAVEVEGNVSIKAYLLAAGLELTSQECICLGARVTYRQKLAGDATGKVRQRRGRNSNRCSKGAKHFGWHKVGTYHPKHLHAELIGLGYDHDQPSAEALKEAWADYLPGPPKLGLSIYNGRSESLPPIES